MREMFISVDAFAFFCIKTTKTNFDNQEYITSVSMAGCDKNNFLSTQQDELPKGLHTVQCSFNLVGKQFDIDTIQLIKSFLRLLSQPVCIIAENGDAFDFPILFHNLKMLNTTLENNTFYCDSAPIFQALSCKNNGEYYPLDILNKALACKTEFVVHVQRKFRVITTEHLQPRPTIHFGSESEGSFKHQSANSIVK